MTQPVPYFPAYNFTLFQASHPSSPLPAASLDAELFSVASSIAEICANLEMIQRDDGALANASVGNDQLKTEVDLGFNSITDWVAPHAYVVRDYVYEDGNIYRCIVAHTSTVFADDYNAGFWLLVVDFSGAGDSAAAAEAAAAIAQDAANTVVGIRQGVSTDIANFSPLNGATIRGWWSMSDYNSLTLVGNGLSQALDKSGGGNLLKQPSASKPTWNVHGAAGTGSNAACINGLMGASTDMLVQDSAAIQNMFSNTGTVVLAVIPANTTGGNQALFAKSTDNAGAFRSGYQIGAYGSAGNDLTPRFFLGATGQYGCWDGPTGALKIGKPYVIEVAMSTTSLAAPVVRLNGKLLTLSQVQAPAGTNNTDAGANLIVGNNQDFGIQPWQGSISQALVYGSGQTAAFMQQLRSYIGSLAGIETVPVFLFGGQSNAVGNAPAGASIYDVSPNADLAATPVIWDGNAFTALNLGNNNRGIDAAHFGSEVSFGAEVSAMANTRAHIIKYALGATSLAVDWLAPNGAQLVLFKAAVDAALASLVDKGCIAQVEAVLWDQGESDGQNLAYANAYQTNLTNFIAYVNGTLLAPYNVSASYKFLVAGLGNVTTLVDHGGGIVQYASTIRAAQQAVATGSTVYIDTTDLALNTDQIHFNSDSQIALGGRYAARLDLKLIKSMVQQQPSDDYAPSWRAFHNFIPDGAIGTAKLAIAPITRINIVILTGSGTYTATAGLVCAYIEAVGPGGGGGGAQGGTGLAAAGAGGGGSGSAASGFYTAAQVGASQSVTIGAPGAGGSQSGPTAGGAGGTTSVGTLVSAGGGFGGGASPTFTAAAVFIGGGFGGSATAGQIQRNGAGGGVGMSYGNTSLGVGGYGAGSVFGGATLNSANGVGVPPTSAGVGGGGASATTAGHDGAPGFRGEVRITEYISS